MKTTSKHSTEQKGFTLIEIALVLVIIALLSGGVLTGLELLEDSRKQKSLEQVQSLSSAWFSYINRYKQLPGDDNFASTRFGGQAENGDGDGELSSSEKELVWQHLHQAKIITGSGNNSTKTPWGNSFDFQFNSDKQIHQLCILNFNFELASFLDLGLDDGDPQAGRIYVSSSSPPSSYTQGNHTVCSQL